MGGEERVGTGQSPRKSRSPSQSQASLMLSMAQPNEADLAQAFPEELSTASTGYWMARSRD